VGKLRTGVAEDSAKSDCLILRGLQNSIFFWYCVFFLLTVQKETYQLLWRIIMCCTTKEMKMQLQELEG